MPTFHISLARPAGYLHTEAFREIAEALHFTLLRLGFGSTVGGSAVRPGARVIVLGGHLLDQSQLAALPPSAILYNLEQLTPELLAHHADYRRALESYEVWDYSEDNVARYATLGLAAKPMLLPIGYVPEWTRIPRREAPEFDVLFYGSVNPRREAILQELRDAGLRVASHFGVYGPERDDLIARSKLVLNIHFYDAQVFEMVRVGYLLANGVPVVAELGPETRIDPALREAVRAVPKEALADTCLELAYDDQAREALGKRAFTCFSALRLEPRLAPLVGAAPGSPAGTPHPLRLNVGSGKDWRADALNLDLHARWRPDACLDLTQPLALPLELETARFGRIALCEGMFEQIVANDVLEHLVDLPAAMTNCLRLLKIGGEFAIKVPYDLSHGAWQDPTHVRAFNERSFKYYTEWFWYLGWTEYRFDLAHLALGLSPLGERLQQEGMDFEELARTPRAVDELRVKLRKRVLTKEEKFLSEKVQGGSR